LEDTYIENKVLMFADETDATLALKSMSAEFAYKI